MAETNFKINVGVKDFARQTNKILKQNIELGDSFKSLGKLAANSFASFTGNLAANAVTGTFNIVKDGIFALTGSLNDFVDAARVQEDAINRLNTQLKITGDFSEETSQDLQNFASTIQEVSKFGDEAVINQIALAKSFGATNEQAKEIVSAATDLSSSFGIDLESATRNVSKTLGGFAGELGEVIPELKNLTTEQLQAGEGVRILAERFRGAAQGEIQTFSGALTQLQNTAGDTGESFGFLITQSPIVTAAISGLNDSFLLLQKFIEDNKEELQGFVNNSVTSAINTIPVLTQRVLDLYEVFINGQNFFGAIENLITEFINQVLKAARGVVSLGQAIGELTGADFNLDSVVDSLTGIIEAGEDQKRLEAEQANARLSQLSSLRTSTEELSNTLRDNLLNSIREVQNVDNQQSDNFVSNKKKEKEAVEQLTESQRKDAEERRKQIEGTIGEAAVDPISAFTGNLPDISGATKEEQGQVDTNRALGAGAGVLGNVLQGQQGAKNLLTSGLSAAANAFLPGLGQVAGPLLGQLFEGPEAVQGLVRNFVQSVPELIDALIESVPVLIETLIEELPGLINSIIKRIPDIIKAIVKGVPDIISGLVAGIPEIISGFIDSIPELIDAFTFGLLSAGPKFVESLIDQIPIIGGGGGGIVGDVLGGIGGALGFAEGGQGFVKRVPNGFNNDTFPARLTSGELVVDRSTARNLESFLNQQGRSSGSGQEVVVRVEASDNFITEIERRIFQNRQLGTGLI